MSSLRPQDLLRDNLTIPTIPEVVVRIQRLVADPEAGTREMGALVAQDAPLAAKVLRIANSAYYGLREPCVSTEQASTVLGARVLRNVVTQAAVMSRFQHLEHHADFRLHDLWRHTVATGHVSAALARHSGAKLGLSADEFYVCGLLHDIGQVVLLDSLGDGYLDLVREGRRVGRPLQLVEQAAFGFDHTDVGALVAQRWSLPDPVVAAIQFHHGPREAIERDPAVRLIATADHLVHRVGAGALETAELLFDAETRGLLGIDVADAAELVVMAERALAGVEF